MSDRCAVFIDQSNIEFAFAKLRQGHGNGNRLKLDYKALIEEITRGLEIAYTKIYLSSENGRDNQYSFFVFLEKIGCTVITKEIKKIKTDTEEIKQKCNFDVEIATDISEAIWKSDCDEIILVSGDSDFRYIIDKIKERRIRIAIVSTINSLSTELRDVADRLILLDKMNLKHITFSK